METTEQFTFFRVYVADHLPCMVYSGHDIEKAVSYFFRYSKMFEVDLVGGSMLLARSRFKSAK